jgi:hypothetical protein
MLYIFSNFNKNLFLAFNVNTFSEPPIFRDLDHFLTCLKTNDKFFTRQLIRNKKTKNNENN